MATKVYLLGLNIVIDTGNGLPKWTPTRSGRVQPHGNTFQISDKETGGSVAIALTDLRDGDNNTFATMDDAAQYLSGFVGGFNTALGGSSAVKLKKVSNNTFETVVAGEEYYSPDQHGSLFGSVYRKYIVVPDNTTSGGILSIPIGVTPTALLNIGGWVLEHTTNRLMPIPNASGATTDPRGMFVAIDGSNMVLDANNGLDWDSGYVWMDYAR